MKISAVAALVLTLSPFGVLTAGEADPLCKPLKAFVASVGPEESRELAFHTSWGSNFKTASEPAIFAKQCVHHGYEPAAAACAALMAHGLVEFSNLNARDAIACLSPGTRWGKHLTLDTGSFSLQYGSGDRGSNVTVVYKEDSEMGGMVLRVVAEGY